jgi:hypothetical protein
MPELWAPSKDPLDDLVTRIHREIEGFAADAGVEQAFVEVELADGLRFALESLAAEPGYGLVTIRPHPGIEEELPEAMIVPVGMIRRIDLRRAEEQRARLGFSLPSA